MDLSELEDSPHIQEQLTNFDNSIIKIEKLLDETLIENVQEKLSTKERIDFDLFTAYSLNTLYWLYLRSSGKDPNKNDIKDQLNRVRDYMTKAKQVKEIHIIFIEIFYFFLLVLQAHERNTIRPKIDQPAANRFIKHSIKENNPNKRQKTK